MEITDYVSNLNKTEFIRYEKIFNDNLGDRKYFIEQNRDQASYFDWLFSKGTNYSCYIQYLHSLDREQQLDNIIDKIRTVIYALHKPLQFTFFYWSILLYILYKFNFKNKILKIITVHLVLRSLGDVVDKFGEIWPRYFSNQFDSENGTIRCSFGIVSSELYPIRWFITRQIGCTLWLTGEIVADWYSLIRTREIVKDKRTIWYVYVTCGLFNLSKICLILHHWRQNIKDFYLQNGIFNNDSFGDFYNIYWTLQLIIIYASVFYDLSVYYVLKKYDFQITNSSISFVKKFKTFSTYRIRVTAICGVVFLPLISITIVGRLYFYYTNKYKHLELSFDEIKQSIANLQYFIIFIDQILLSYSKTNESSTNTINSESQNKSMNRNISSYTYLSNLKKQNEKLNSSSNNRSQNSSRHSNYMEMEYNSNNNYSNINNKDYSQLDTNDYANLNNSYGNINSRDYANLNNSYGNINSRDYSNLNNSYGNINSHDYSNMDNINDSNLLNNNFNNNNIDINNVSLRNHQYNFINDDEMKSNNINFRNNNYSNYNSFNPHDKDDNDDDDDDNDDDNNVDINSIKFKNINTNYDNFNDNPLNYHFHHNYNFKNNK